MFTLPKSLKGAKEKEVYLSNGLVFESIDMAMIITNNKNVTTITVPIGMETVNVNFFAHYSHASENVWCEIQLMGDHCNIESEDLGYIDFEIERSAGSYKVKSNVQTNFTFEDFSEDFQEFIHKVFCANQDDEDNDWIDQHADFVHDECKLREV